MFVFKHQWCHLNKRRRSPEQRFHFNWEYKGVSLTKKENSIENTSIDYRGLKCIKNR